MVAREEAVIRSFWSEAQVPEHHWDESQIDRLIDYMSPEIRYHVYAWEEPVVGTDAVRKELVRQAPLFHDFRSEVLAVASHDGTVFLQHHDSMMIGRKPLTQNGVSVFDIDADGKIAKWRDYYDSKEIAVKLGVDVNKVSSAGARGFDR